MGQSAGLASTERGRGAALADFDGDGRLDVLVLNRRAPLEIYPQRKPRCRSLAGGFAPTTGRQSPCDRRECNRQRRYAAHDHRWRTCRRTSRSAAFRPWRCDPSRDHRRMAQRAHHTSQSCGQSKRHSDPLTSCDGKDGVSCQTETLCPVFCCDMALPEVFSRGSALASRLARLWALRAGQRSSRGRLGCSKRR